MLGQVKGDINGIEGAAKRAGSNLGRNLTIGATVAAAGIATQVNAGINSLVELERVENLTAAALESTGNKANQSVAGIRARAEELERLTGVDDKVIQNAENLLLTFANIGEKAFEPTLESAINLNAALGGNDESLQNVLLQVAKAVNDPIRGMTALRRSGVSFTEAQQKQVKELVKANDLMGAQAIVLGELETQFGGAAEAANQGATRAQRRWADAIEDIQKSLATGFMPLIERVSDKMSELVADPKFLAGVEDFGNTLADGFDKALDFAEGIDWAAVGSAVSTMGTGAKMAMDAFLSAPPWLQTAILTGWGLNKLTGGALGSLVGELGKGLIKGVLGMNAGVVNAKAGVVNVAGPGVGGPGGFPTGGGPGGRRGPTTTGGGRGFGWGSLLKILPPIFAAEAAAALEGPSEDLARAINESTFLKDNPLADVNLNDLQWPFGTKNTPTILPEVFGGNGLLGGTAPGGRSAGGSFAPASGAERADAAAAFDRFGGKLDTLATDEVIQQLARTTEMGLKGVGTTFQVGLKTGLDPVGDIATRILARAEDPKAPPVMAEIQGHISGLEQIQRQYLSQGDVKLAAKVQTNIDALHNLIGTTDRQNAILDRQRAEAAGADAAMIGAAERTRAAIDAKNFSPRVNVTVPVNTFVSINEWQRTVQSSARAYSDNSGGI